MAMYDLEAMNSVATNLESLIEEWKTSVNDLYSIYTELDDMWDGDANDTFNDKFLNDDKSKYDILADTLVEYLEALKNAVKQYTEAENQVSSMFN